MKKGKTSKIQGFKIAKVVYGTVDSFELNSIYLNIQSWIEPKEDVDNWGRVVLNLSRSIKHTIYHNLNKELFKQNFIVDLDLRSSGISPNKKSFLNLEINFFTNQSDLDFKCPEIKNCLKDITKNIIKDNFLNNKYFSFTLTKKDKNDLTEI